MKSEHDYNKPLGEGFKPAEDFNIELAIGDVLLQTLHENFGSGLESAAKNTIRMEAIG
jgi:hypothetical protein